MGVAAEINWLAFPVDFEAVGAARKRVNGWAIVGQRVEVLVFAIGSDDATIRLRRVASAASSRSWESDGGSGGGRTDAIASGPGTDVHRLGDAINGALNPGQLWGGNGLCGHNGVVAASASLAVGLEESPFLAQPALAICGKVLHDLGSKGQGQLVILASGREHLAKEAGRSCSDMFVDHALVVLHLGVGKQRWLRRAGGRRLVYWV